MAEPLEQGLDVFGLPQRDDGSSRVAMVMAREEEWDMGGSGI